MKKKRAVVLPYLLRHAFAYGIGLLMLLVVDYANLYIPQITSQLIDGLTTFTLTYEMAGHLALRVLLIAGVIALGRVCWRMMIIGSSRKIEREIRNDMFGKLEELSPDYFKSHKTGDLMANFTNDIEALRNALGFAIIGAFDTVVMTAMTLYKMVSYVNLQLTLLVLIPMAIIAIGGYYFGFEFEKRFAKKQDAFGKLSDFIQESITGERVIKAFVEEEHQDQQMKKYNQENLDANLRVVSLMAYVYPILDMVIGISFAICIVYGGYLTITGQISLGRFVAFNQYIEMLIWPMIALGDSITQFSQGIAASERIGQIFNEDPTIIDDVQPASVDALQGDIDLNHVTFVYEDGHDAALHDIHVKIRAGETLAILGRTGSGKTTLVNALLRLADIQEGSIQFDGIDIKKVPLKVLRTNISYVPQDNYLFSDTIENNIKFGRANATHEEVVQACEDACVHSNIVDFPDGYQTVVGERGVTLSGGQKQRCSIARALLKNAPILILDDALSAVDTDTEDKILANLKKERAGKTTLMIAHRVSTVKNADHILMLDEGRMVEYGTFEDLMSYDSAFKSMYEKQQLEKQLSQEE